MVCDSPDTCSVSGVCDSRDSVSGVCQPGSQHWRIGVDCFSPPLSKEPLPLAGAGPDLLAGLRRLYSRRAWTTGRHDRPQVPPGGRARSVVTVPLPGGRGERARSVGVTVEAKNLCMG